MYDLLTVLLPPRSERGVATAGGLFQDERPCSEATAKPKAADDICNSESARVARTASNPGPARTISENVDAHAQQSSPRMERTMSDNSASRGLEGKILPFLGAPPPPPPDSDDEDGEEVASETMGFAPSLDALEVLEAPPPPPDQDELYAAPQTHLKPAGTTPTAKQRSFKRGPQQQHLADGRERSASSNAQDAIRKSPHVSPRPSAARRQMSEDLLASPGASRSIHIAPNASGGQARGVSRYAHC